MEFEARGEKFWLACERALLWPAEATLAIADLHLGKAEAFQKSGLRLPSQPQKTDLVCIERLIQKSGARRVVFLGDLVHSRAGITPAVEAMFADFLDSFAGEAIVTIGNHDRAIASAWPQAWRRALLTERFDLGDFAFQHIPPEPARGEDSFCWSGHLHPMTVIGDGVDRLRLPSFVIERDQGVLPAFSSLAGGTNVYAARGRRVFVAGANRVFEV